MMLYLRAFEKIVGKNVVRPDISGFNGSVWNGFTCQKNNMNQI